MLTPTFIYEYERVLIERRKVFPNYIFADYRDTKETIALDIIRYGIKKYLGWNAERAKTNLTYALLKKIKVYDLIGYICHPPEIDLYTDLFFIINKLYPSGEDFNFRDQVIGTYKKVLKGQLSRFPKGFFEGVNGELRAALCLQYALNNQKVFSSLEDGYAFFASPKGPAFLKEAKIFGPVNTLFTTPLEYFHYSLGEDLQSEFFYNFYNFTAAYKEITKAAP